MSQIIVNTTFRHNGIEYAFDIEDVENVEKYENAFERMKSDEKLIKKDGSKSEYIKGYCNMIRNLFDGIFGDGAGIAICGEKLNSRTDTEAYEAFLDFIAEQSDAGLQIKNNVAMRYANRAQRRAAAKAK